MMARSCISSDVAAPPSLQDFAVKYLREEMSKAESSSQSAHNNDGSYENEGVHILATYIEKIMARLQIQFSGTRIRLHRSWPEPPVDDVSLDGWNSISIEIRDIMYRDETPELEFSNTSEPWMKPQEYIKTVFMHDIKMSVLRKADQPSEIILQSSQDEKAWIRMKLPTQKDSGNVSVDVWMPRFAVCLVSADFVVVLSIMDALKESYRLMREFDEEHPHSRPMSPVSSMFYSASGDSVLSNTFADRVSKGIQISMLFQQIEIYLMSSGRSQDHLQHFFSTLFEDHSDLTNEARLSFEELFGKWIGQDHLKFVFANISSVIDMNSGTISVANIRGYEWLSAVQRRLTKRLSI
jgi:hypothetical protein